MRKLRTKLGAKHLEALSFLHCNKKYSKQVVFLNLEVVQQNRLF